MSPTFESKFARMEYLGNAKFALYFMRHTGEWVGLDDALSVDECMKAIQDDPTQKQQGHRHDPGGDPFLCQHIVAGHT